MARNTRARYATGKEQGKIPAPICGRKVLVLLEAMRASGMPVDTPVAAARPPERDPDADRARCVGAKVIAGGRRGYEARAADTINLEARNTKIRAYAAELRARHPGMTHTEAARQILENRAWCVKAHVRLSESRLRVLIR